jgi:ankyrin repeat domain-containing protein 17
LCTPLVAAAEAGHSRVVRLLLKEGANRNRGGKGGLTALHVACHCGHAKVVKLLAEVCRSE